MLRGLNSAVKRREPFRPFAPSVRARPRACCRAKRAAPPRERPPSPLFPQVLAEHASEWFEGIPAVPADDDDGAHEAAAAAFSPYMSFTTRVRPARAAEVRRR